MNKKEILQKFSKTVMTLDDLAELFDYPKDYFYRLCNSSVCEPIDDKASIADPTLIDLLDAVMQDIEKTGRPATVILKRYKVILGQYKQYVNIDKTEAKNCYDLFCIYNNLPVNKSVKYISELAPANNKSAGYKLLANVTSIKHENKMHTNRHLRYFLRKIGYWNTIESIKNSDYGL